MFVNPEGRPDRSGLRLSNELAKLDIPVKLLIDSAVAYSMDEVDMVFVGADGVVESGGIINMMGTYQIALVAKSMNKPVYVAAESYKVIKVSILPHFCPQVLDEKMSFAVSNTGYSICLLICLCNLHMLELLV